MERVYEPQEIEFDFTRLFYKLEKICPEHGVGEKNLDLQRYACPACNKILKKKRRL